MQATLGLELGIQKRQRSHLVSISLERLIGVFALPFVNCLYSESMRGCVRGCVWMLGVFCNHATARNTDGSAQMVDELFGILETTWIQSSESINYTLFKVAERQLGVSDELAERLHGGRGRGLRESLYEQKEETLVYEDNRDCILMSENPLSREKSRHVEPIQRLVAECDLPRHVDIRQRFLRELVNLKVMRLMPCSTHKMVADALTKSLPEPAYRMHRAEMFGESDMPYCAFLLHVMRPRSGGGCTVCMFVFPHLSIFGLPLARMGESRFPHKVT